MTSKEMFWNLQIMRGFAAIIVVIAHANLMVDSNLFNGWFIIGWCGVDFFFVLSGFIIYYTNHSSIGYRNKFFPYIKKRLIRIYPIYWLYTIIVVGLNFIVLSLFGKNFITWIDLDFSGTMQSIILYPTNILINQMPILPVAWTLSYEMLFYIMFALLIVLPLRVSITLICLWIGLIIANIIGIIAPTNPAYYVFTNGKNIEFFAGCFIAHLTLYKTNYSNKHPLLAITLGLALLWLGWLNEHHKFITVANLGLIEFGFPFALITFGMAALDKTQHNDSKGRIKKILIYLGDASYSIYLVHFIVIIIVKNFLFKFTTINSLVSFFLAIIISIVVGCSGYSFLEKPILRWIRKPVSTKKIRIASE